MPNEIFDPLFFIRRKTITGVSMNIIILMNVSGVRSHGTPYTDTVPSVRKNKQAAGMMPVINVLPLKCGCFSMSDS